MQPIVRLSITLPADMARLVRSQVADGRYASNSEVIRAALRAWQAQEALRDAELAALRARIVEADADPRPSLSEAEVKARLAARHRASREHG